MDTEGIALKSAAVGIKLTVEKAADALKASEIEEKVKHRKLMIPGKSACLSGEIEELSGWQVLVNYNSIKNTHTRNLSFHQL